MDRTTSSGMVYLVGAGPGNPGLITVRGAECLRRAQVVLYDYLVNPQLLELAPHHAELICLGKHGTGKSSARILLQIEIDSMMVNHARAGRIVVRLKGGDPAIFGHAAEELAALESAGIPYEIVPGITAALAAGSHAGIPITSRDDASALAIITGQERSDKAGFELDYASLAAFPGTLIIYMGVTTARHWAIALIAGGKPSDTPVAMIRRCSWPDQQTILCTLGEVADRMETDRLRPPVIVVIGNVVEQAQLHHWFVDRPLFGQTVIVTRAANQSPELRDRLAELGANVLIQPAIEISEPVDWGPVDRAIENIKTYDWLVFSSSNGVRAFLERLMQSGQDARALGHAKLGAIGPATSEELLRYGLRADVIPAKYRAESLAAALAPQVRGQRFLLIRASRGREVLAESLRASRALVEQVVAYSSKDVSHLSPEVMDAVSNNRVDWVTVTSSAIARSLALLFGNHLAEAKLASISPITSETLRSVGYEPTVEASEYTMPGLVRAIVSYQKSN